VLTVLEECLLVEPIVVFHGKVTKIKEHFLEKSHRFSFFVHKLFPLKRMSTNASSDSPLENYKSESNLKCMPSFHGNFRGLSDPYIRRHFLGEAVFPTAPLASIKKIHCIF